MTQKNLLQPRKCLKIEFVMNGIKLWDILRKLLWVHPGTNSGCGKEKRGYPTKCWKYTANILQFMHFNWFSFSCTFPRMAVFPLATSSTPHQRLRGIDVTFIFRTNICLLRSQPLYSYWCSRQSLHHYLCDVIGQLDYFKCYWCCEVQKVGSSINIYRTW